MKVRDLIHQLQQFDADDEVHISFNYGDHWRTIVAPKVRRVGCFRWSRASITECRWSSMRKTTATTMPIRSSILACEGR